MSFFQNQGRPNTSLARGFAIYSSDPEQVIANLMLFSAKVEYAVHAALRRAAQYTATATKRRVQAKTGAPQKTYKNQIKWFTREWRGNERVNRYYKVWMGQQFKVGADEVPRARAAAKRAGAKYYPRFGKGLFIQNRETNKRERVYAVDLHDFEADMKRIAAIGSKRIYKQRLRTEIKTRSKKVKSKREADALMRAWDAIATRAQTNAEE